MPVGKEAYEDLPFTPTHNKGLTCREENIERGKRGQNEGKNGHTRHNPWTNHSPFPFNPHINLETQLGS